MAEGWLRQMAADRVEVFSAGIEAHGLNPRAVAVMKEAGVDISSHTSKTVDAVTGVKFDLVITVCDNARERCPYYPGAVQLHQNFPDPARVVGSEEEIMEAFRSVRDQIRQYCRMLVAQHIH